MRRLLVRWLPRRITGQIALIVVVAFVATQIVAGIAFSALRGADRPARHPGGRPHEIETLAQILDRIPDDRTRSAVLAAAGGLVPGAVGIPGDAAMPAVAVSDREQAEIDHLRTELGGKIHIFATRESHDGPLLLAVRTSNGRLFVMPFPRMPTPPWHMLLVMLGFGLAIILLVSLWTARQLTAPLSRFARAAERFSAGKAPDEPLDENGPIEVKRVAQAFNEMRARIRALVDERTKALAAIGHDLRTPITRMRLRAEEIDDDTLRGQMTRDLVAMESLVQSGLRFLRDRETAERHLENVDMPALLQVICDDFADMGHAVTYAGPLHVSLACDPEAIGRAVTNLVDNGVKYGSAVTVRLSEASSGACVIEVEDDGPGIPDAAKPAVFEPFFRLDAERPMRGPDNGFGLGLSIARTITEKHDGRLLLKDGVKGGLVASLELPKRHMLATQGV